MEYFIERRLREFCLDGLDGQSALPDLLYDVLYLNDRTRTDDLQKILFEKGIAQSGEVRVDSRIRGERLYNSFVCEGLELTFHSLDDGILATREQ